MQHADNLEFASTSPKQNVTTFNNDENQDQDPLKKIQYDCCLDLIKALCNYASELNVCVSKVINLRAIKLMAHQLPTTEDEMLNIAFLTKANYEKYGKILLNITQKYYEKYALYENELSTNRLRMSDNCSHSDSLDDGEQSSDDVQLRMSNDCLDSVSLDDGEQSLDDEDLRMSNDCFECVSLNDGEQSADDVQLRMSNDSLNSVSLYELELSAASVL